MNAYEESFDLVLQAPPKQTMKEGQYDPRLPGLLRNGEVSDLRDCCKPAAHPASLEWMHIVHG